MDNLLGDRLKQQGVTEGQLQQALERQRLHGGRLGANLAALGFISEAALSVALHRDPPAPRTLQESGLSLPFIVDLIMKHLLFLGSFNSQEIAGRIWLPLSLVEMAMEEIRRAHLVDIKGAEGLTSMSYRYTLTERGKARAAELMGVSRYLGPAPVTLESYRHMVEVQTVKNILVGEAEVKQAFSQLIVSEQMLRRLGPAISSGRAMFLYGPPGNGKTTIAETISKVLPEHIYIPHAILVGDDIITLFDPVNHREADASLRPAGTDLRWAYIRRPIVMAGGELTLKMLDLEYNPISRFYQAPLQLKANNGLFIIDDFGRQQVDPQQLLNRWIVPLERRTDFLALQSGMKFEIPFDQLSIFSTNIEPKKLVDEAFLRRIRYKVLIDHPTAAEFEEIFRRVAASNGIAFNQETFDFLVENFYKGLGVKFNACHPRDLIDQIIDAAHYHGNPPAMDRESMTTAWKNYFVDI
ncbi:MAG: ATPase [Gammaproteobacteria bacterium]|nr:ATPase [Gammaproteobacteria bacterium]